MRPDHVSCVARSSLENSREMNEKSHRATRRCYRRGVEAFLYRALRRLDGRRLYNPSVFPRRRISQAGRRPVRSSGCQCDGGLLLFKALDTELGLSRRLAACLDDPREPGKVVHETIDLLQQRIFWLCGGYADCNDAARLVHDPIHSWCSTAIR
jgi:hypothetical protein